jgi:hypothetical protein
MGKTSAQMAGFTHSALQGPSDESHQGTRVHASWCPQVGLGAGYWEEFSDKAVDFFFPINRYLSMDLTQSHGPDSIF